MLDKNNFKISLSNKLINIPNKSAYSNPNLGFYSENTNNIDNLDDYLNFAWKYENSVINDFDDKLKWFDNLSQDFSVDLEDKISYHYENSILGVSTLENNLESYLFGNSDYGYASWQLPESHPLKANLLLPGSDDFIFNTNWYERLQSSFRNLWLYKTSGRLSEFNNEYEYFLLREVGLFYTACKNTALKLLNSLLSSNFDNIPDGFIEITRERFPFIYKFHSPKFKDDRLFLYDGILFTLVVGNTSSYSKFGYKQCKKLYSNDFKGKQALCDAVHSMNTISRFALPLCCSIDYMGFRVVAEPLLPLGSDTKFLLESLLGYESNSYDSHTVSTKILSNEQLSNDLFKLSSHLRLSSWPLPFGSSDFKDNDKFNNNCNAVDSKGLLHFINTHEILPPYVDSEGLQKYNYRLRQEFTCFYYNHSLKCSLNSQPLFNKKFDNSVFKEAAEYNHYLIENNMDKFRTITGSWDLNSTIHSFGLNMKNIGILYDKTTHSALKDVIAAEMTARAFKHLWEVEIEEFFRSKHVNIELIDVTFLKMLNDLLGLTLDTVSFWQKKIHPQISLHFNAIDLQSINFKTIPQMLLINSLEFNMGVSIPKLKGGSRHTAPIKLEDFRSSYPPALLCKGMSTYLLNKFYPKVSVTCPRFNLSLYKAASKLLDNQDLYGYSFLVNSNSFGLGLAAHIKSKLLGTGYPCDPICVYNTEIICSRFNHTVTAINLFCLAESLLLSSPLTRFKLLLMLGYSFFQHRLYNKALHIAKFLSEKSSDILPLYIESKLLEFQCHCLKGDSELVESDYNQLLSLLTNLEGFDGFLKLQLLIIICYYKWINKDYKNCLSLIQDSTDSYLHFFSVKKYEWIPTFLLSLMGYCNMELGIHHESTKVNHELVRLCNLSNLPSYTKCNMLWLFLESLIRAGSYSHAQKISSDLSSVLRAEFGPLSLEYLRSLYVTAWINRQMGAIHFVHPYLYLSNSENLILYKGQLEWFENKDLIMEELSSANNSISKRNNLKESLSLYIIVLDKFLELSRDNNMKIIELVNNIDPNFCTKKLEEQTNITYQCLLKYGNEAMLDLLDDPFLKIYLEQSSIFQSKLIVVIENFLTLKIQSLDTKQCHAIANKLYNAYASQISSNYTKQLSTGPTQDILFQNDKQTYGYGSRLQRVGESFSSHLSIKTNIIPKSGHDLRSIEMLLLGDPEYSKHDICEMCIENCKTGSDFDTWFYSVFDFVHPKCDLTADKFLLSLDILRNFSTSCLRMFILGHLANISNSDLNQTLTFKSFMKTMNKCKNNKSIYNP